MKKFLLVLCSIFFAVSVLEFVYILNNKNWFVPHIGHPVPKPKPLLEYTFNNLKHTKFQETKITFGKAVKNNKDFKSRIFYFYAPKTPEGKTMGKVSGLINIPAESGDYPVIVMFRGYMPKDSYKSGDDTQPSAQVFVKHGFITLAPDFLGYGESASPSADSFEDRFQTYTTALSLLTSLPTLNASLNKEYSGVTADLSKVGIWGHSNGGHIALATLAISGTSYPTVLWAPVSASFPYSILYYTDETKDQGRALRKALAGFEKVYNTDFFSPLLYYKWIKAPIEIDQGMSDHEVPVWWSDNLVSLLEKYNITVAYHTYQDADHNFLPQGWSDAVSNSISFYDKYFSKNK